MSTEQRRHHQRDEPEASPDVVGRTSLPSGDRESNLAGIVWMVAAVGILSVMDATMKTLAAHYPPVQVTALRGMVSLPLVLLWIALAGGFAQVFTKRWRLQVARGVLGIFMLTGFIYTVRSLPLSEAYAIFFVAPLFVTALSVPLLGEHVDGKRWAAIAVGLLGVLVVLRPTSGAALSLAGMVAVFSAGCYALSVVMVRVLGRTDSTLSMVFWFVVLVTLGAGAVAAPRWVPLQAAHWPVLAALGVTGVLGQYAITEAFRRGEASVVAPFEYTALGWGVALDWVLWSTRPDRGTLAGAAIIVAAGLYLIRREREREHEHVEAEHP